MSQLLSYNNGTIEFNPQCRQHAPFMTMLKEDNLQPLSPEEENIFKFIFFVYDRDSTYFTILPISERKEIVAQDMGIAKKYVFWEDEQNYRDIVRRLEKLQFTPSERILHTVNKKVDEYLEMVDTVKIKKDNYKEANAIIKSSKDLIQLRQEVERMVLEGSVEEVRGGGETTLFENEEGAPERKVIKAVKTEEIDEPVEDDD